MDGQISIFDWMPEAVPAVAFPNINDITEETAVRMVGNEIGVEFVYNELFHHWEAKVGRPCDSIEDAVKFFRKNWRE